MINAPIANAKNQPILRVFSAFFLCFFLVMTLLTAFVAVPKINQAIETQHIVDSQVTLEIETELFTRFINRHRTALQGLARFPVIASAALLSKSDNPDFTDLVDNFFIAGQKSRLVLQNIAGDVIYQTTQNLYGDFTPNALWIKNIINEKDDFNFQLLKQEGDYFRFVISVPVTYINSTEGVLSAEIKAPLIDAFSPKTIAKGGAFKVKQNDVIVQTNMAHIALPREVSTSVLSKKIELTYINDDTQVLRAQNNLRNIILGVLFVGFAISFILFTLLGYRVFVNDEEINISKSSFLSRAYLLPALIAVIGIATSVSGFFVLNNLNAQKVQQAIITDNKTHILSVKNRIQTSLRTLESLKALYDASSRVDRQEFTAFTMPHLNSNSDIQALKWVPKILKGERSEYEERARADGIDNFNIVERNEEGDIEVAPDRDVYFPVYYVEPMSRNINAIGLDSPANEKRAQAIAKAQRTGKMTAAGVFNLVQDTGEQPALLIFNPVYEQKGIDSLNTYEHEENFKGLVLMILRIADVVDNALEAHSDHSNIFIEDITDPDNPEVILSALESNVPEPSFISTANIDVAGRVWRVRVFPSADAISNSFLWAGLIFLLGGGVFTLFITYTLMQLIRRKKVIEAIVKKRTKEVRELSSAMENAVEGVSQINSQGEYVYLNEAYAATCGYTPNELTGRAWDITVHSDDHEMMDEAYKIMIENGKVVEEPQGVRKDGSIFHKRVTMISQYDEDGFFVGHHCFMSDISERKEAERKLYQANKELEEFAYRTSHDLRSPLVSSIGLLGVAQRAIDSDKKEQALETVKQSKKSLSILEKLVEDILMLTKTNNIQEENKVLNVQEIVKGVFEKFSNMDNFDNLNIETFFNYDAQLKTKESRFILIVENLISNAIKYQDTKRENSFINVSTYEQNNEFVIEVRDNGLGVPHDHHNQMFAMFKRFHPRISFGSGLGLYMSLKSAQIIGGTLHYEDTKEGSVFKLFVPKKQK